jgi:hypothetical protein
MINDLWYKNAVIYCLSVGTFMDSNGDGIGDFKGLMRRLDYLHGLGVTAIWLMPFQVSPHRDDGYDVSDYYGVDPRYGTIGDFGQVPAAGSSPRRSGRFTYPRSNANVLDMAPGLRELIALSLLAGLGCGVALAHGDLIFVAIFACAIAMTTNETMRRLR